MLLKKLLLCIFSLLLLTSCKKFDLTNFHSIGDSWNDVLDDVEYTFEYSSLDEEGVYLKITRNNDFFRNEEYDDDIFVYSKSDSFDYVLIDGKRINEELVNSVFPIGVYDVGDNNSSELFIHTSLDKFEGYVKAEICSQPTTSDSMHIVRITLH